MASLHDADSAGNDVGEPLYSRQFPSLYVLALLPILLGFLALFCRKPADWELVYLPASQRLLAGEDLYISKSGYLYPPFMTLMAMPFGALPVLAARVAWWAVSACCLVLLCRWSWRLGGGLRWPSWRLSSWPEHVVCLAGLATGIFYAFNCLSNQQTDLIIAALMLGGCLLLQRGHDMQGATFLGLAAAMKCTPLLWTAYLIWKRRWHAALWLVAVAIGVNLLPDLVHGSTRGKPWLLVWGADVLALGRSADVGIWGCSAHLNQSLAGLTNRLFLSEWSWTNGVFRSHRLEQPLVDSLTLKIALYAIEASLLLGCLVLCRRSWSNERPWKTGSTPEFGIECSMVFLLMLLMSPASSKAHFGILLLPGFVLARTALDYRSLGLAACLLSANLIGLPALRWFGPFLSHVSLYWGAVTLKTLLLLAGCSAALVLIRRNQAQGIQSTMHTAQSQRRIAA